METTNYLPVDAHTSAETAYTQDDYPYGYTLRTQIRYWLEYKPSHGYRLMAQTMNPKTNLWNKPKASIYAPEMRLYLNDQGHLHAYHFHTNQGLKEIERATAHGFFKDHPRAEEIQRKTLKMDCIMALHTMTIAGSIVSHAADITPDQIATLKNPNTTANELKALLNQLNTSQDAKNAKN